MNNGYALDGYVDVATRVAEFRALHPQGCLRPHNPDIPYRVETIGDQTFIVYVAAAYRSPDDLLPGIGVAWEPFPGRTPYTRGSELQNAETSSWGRAIVAALAADTRRGIATEEDVRAREGDQAMARHEARSTARKAVVPAPRAPEEDTRISLINAVAVAAKAAGVSREEVAAQWAAAHEGQHIKDATDVGALELLRDDLAARKAQ